MCDLHLDNVYLPFVPEPEPELNFSNYIPEFIHDAYVEDAIEAAVIDDYETTYGYVHYGDFCLRD